MKTTNFHFFSALVRNCSMEACDMKMFLSFQVVKNFGSWILMGIGDVFCHFGGFVIKYLILSA